MLSVRRDSSLTSMQLGIAMRLSSGQGSSCRKLLEILSSYETHLREIGAEEVSLHKVILSTHIKAEHDSACLQSQC